jgi:hypothetical protein
MGNSRASDSSAKLAAMVDWIDDDFTGHIGVKREGDQWFALLMDFDITGAGATRTEAIEQSLHLLTAYLLAFFDEGRAFKDAVRPIPARLRLRIIVESAVARRLRTALPRLERPSEATYALPLRASVA